MTDLELRPQIVEELREMASRGASVRHLVAYVQSELGLHGDAILPVLWYFTGAFHLRLGEVLPIREWLGTANDEEIDALILPAIDRAKTKWSA